MQSDRLCRLILGFLMITVHISHSSASSYKGEMLCLFSVSYMFLLSVVTTLRSLSGAEVHKVKEKGTTFSSTEDREEEK